MKKLKTKINLIQLFQVILVIMYFIPLNYFISIYVKSEISQKNRQSIHELKDEIIQVIVAICTHCYIYFLVLVNKSFNYQSFFLKQIVCLLKDKKQTI